MNGLTLFSLTAGPLLAFQGISPPTEGSIPMGSPAILPPGVEVETPRESGSERDQRLMDAGVIPTPAPPEIEKGKLAKDLSKILDGAKSGDNLKAAKARIEMDIGSWYALREPTGVTYEPDLAHGFSALLSLGGEDIAANKWSTSDFVGVQGLFFNGTGYEKVEGIWGQDGRLFFEFASSEYGAVYASYMETKIDDNQTWGFTFRAVALPLRWVRSQNYSRAKADKASEAYSHFVPNYYGVGGEGGVVWTYGRVGEIQAFLGFQGAAPFQVRMRYGLRFSLLDR